jgi:hypothetical protein
MSESLYTTQVPSGGNNSDGTPSIVTATTLKFATAGQITAGRFYATANTGGTWTYLVWEVTGTDAGGAGTGTLLGSQVATGITGSTWNTVTLTTPINVVSTKLYRVGIHNSQGRYVNTGHIFDAGAIVNGNLTGVADASNPLGNGWTINNGTFAIGSTSTDIQYPKSTFQGTNYFVDVVFTAGSTTPFTRDYSSTWRSFAGITRDYSSTWRSLATFTRDYSSTWAVYNALTRDYVSSWRVLNAFTKDYASNWRSLAGFTSDYASSWRVLGAFTRDYSSVWRVLNTWVTDYATTWRVLNGLTQDYADAWRVLNAFAKDYTSTWAVLSGTAFFRDYTTTWRVTNQFSADYQSTWAVLNAFARDYVSNWRIFGGFTRDYSSSWRVYRQFIRDFSSTWVVFGQTPDGLIAQVWTGSTLIAVGSVSIWDGAQEVPAVIEAVTG